MDFGMISPRKKKASMNAKKAMKLMWKEGITLKQAWKKVMSGKKANSPRRKKANSPRRKKANSKKAVSPRRKKAIANSKKAMNIMWKEGISLKKAWSKVNRFGDTVCPPGREPNQRWNGSKTMLQCIEMCPPGKFRYPETNRCRNIVATGRNIGATAKISLRDLQEIARTAGVSIFKRSKDGPGYSASKLAIVPLKSRLTRAGVSYLNPLPIALGVAVSDDDFFKQLTLMDDSRMPPPFLPTKKLDRANSVVTGIKSYNSAEQDALENMARYEQFTKNDPERLERDANMLGMEQANFNKQKKNNLAMDQAIVEKRALAAVAEKEAAEKKAAIKARDLVIAENPFFGFLGDRLPVWAGGFDPTAYNKFGKRSRKSGKCPSCNCVSLKDLRAFAVARGVSIFNKTGKRLTAQALKARLTKSRVPYYKPGIQKKMVAMPTGLNGYNQVAMPTGLNGNNPVAMSKNEYDVVTDLVLKREREKADEANPVGGFILNRIPEWAGGHPKESYFGKRSSFGKCGGCSR